MSGWKDDPIVLDDDDDEEEEEEYFVSKELSELNDDQFELVKERFAALLPKYGNLWRQMLPEKEEEEVDEKSATLPLEDEVVDGCSGDCTCAQRITSFLPSSILNNSNLQDMGEKEKSEAGEINYCSDSDEETSPIVVDTISCQDRPNNQANGTDIAPEQSASILSQPDANTQNRMLHPPHYESQEVSSRDSLWITREGRFHGKIDFAEHQEGTVGSFQPSHEIKNLTFPSFGDVRDQDESTGDDDEGRSNSDEEDEEEESDEASAASTVIQWDSWRQQTEENSPPMASRDKSTTPSTIKTLTDKRSSPTETSNGMIRQALARLDNDTTHRENTQPTSLSQRHDILSVDDSSDGEIEWNGSVEWGGSQSPIEEEAEEEDGDVDGDDDDYIDDLAKAVATVDISDDDEEDMGIETFRMPQRGSDRQSKRAFKATRDTYARELLASFDDIVCSGKLGTNATVTWSNKLRTSAGITRLQRNKISGERFAQIELSTKVVDNEARLRSTLMHEVCHAAAFLVDGISKPAHGDCFKKWSRRAMQKVPNVEVTTTHDYVVEFKYFWSCGRCGIMYKRHSKSIDPTKSRCGACKGTLFACTEDGTAKQSRAPTPYQIFFQEHSFQVREKLKKSNSNVPQAAVMKECARLWRKLKATGMQSRMRGEDLDLS